MPVERSIDGLIAEGAEKENAILRDRLENLLIAIGMGWDLDGVVAEAQAALIVGANVGAEMVVVPRVPTDEMVRAGSKARADTGSLNGEVNTKATYRAMIQAAPTVGADVGADETTAEKSA